MTMKTIKAVIKNKTIFIYAEVIKEQIWFHFKGFTFVVPNHTNRGNQVDLSRSPDLKKAPSKFKIKGSNTDIKILAPMPGQIVKILTVSGQKILKNQALLILSAMKMEYTLKAPYHGKVTMVSVKEGDRVTADQILITIQED